MSGRLRILALAACAVCAALPAPAAAQFGDIGGIIKKAKTVSTIGQSLRKISEPEEIKIGGELAATLLGAAPLVQQPSMQRYVNRMGSWLAQHSERPNLPWKFGVIESPDFNAFSTPGGYVLISRGLFDQMRNESELAGVLAHEIAHVVKRHQIGALQKGLQSQALGDMKDYMGGGGIGGEFAKALISSGKEMFVRGLDKGDEYEADQMGVVIAARSGYSPYGLVGVLQTLSAAPTDKGFALMFKTHPAPVDRIDKLGTAMGTKLDGITNVVEDLPSFDALRNPRAAPAPVLTPMKATTPAQAAKKKKKR